MGQRKPLVLAIMDGWGVATPWGGNATTVAKTPTIANFWHTSPHTLLEASGESVGLPKGEPGNSEVGHLNIGSGRVVHQDLPSISSMISDGSFFYNKVLNDAMRLASQNGRQLHLIGLVSGGGIHSHVSHLIALIEMARREKVERLLIHAITDGRDTPPMDALRYIEQIEREIKDMPGAMIATVSGRFFAMDRDNHWERIEKVYKALTEGVGNEAISARNAISVAYQNGQTDEFIVPTIIRAPDQTRKTIKDGDVIIFFNFRADRARELTQALVKEKLKGFSRPVKRKELTFVTFTSYQENLPVNVAFEEQKIINSLASVFSARAYKQLHMAETEKYPHVTYFFNGGQEKSFEGEDRIMIPSPRLVSYEQNPAMSAPKLVKTALQKIKNYDFTVINFANPDMVVHTGSMRAAIKAVETVDNCINLIYQEIKRLGGDLIVTADHGNVEQMVDPASGLSDKEHTTNPVPFFFLSSQAGIKLREKGVLADIAPTILDYCGIPIPQEMAGKSLLVSKGNSNV